MKLLQINKFVLLFAFSISILATTSCKLSINGDLDGQWQVMSVDPEPTDKPFEDRLYMCFYQHTCQLSAYGINPWATGNIKYDEKKTLYMDFPNYNSKLSIARLKQYGINRNPVTFTVEHISSSKMILRDGDVVVTLRKF